jgi:hypothetical protein
MNKYECDSINQDCGSGPGLVPDSMTLWIRMPDPDPGSESEIECLLGIRIHTGSGINALWIRIQLIC